MNSWAFSLDQWEDSLLEWRGRAVPVVKMHSFSLDQWEDSRYLSGGEESSDVTLLPMLHADVETYLYISNISSH